MALLAPNGDAHAAAADGNPANLHALNQQGGYAAASLSAEDAEGRTPAHHAAANGRGDCLTVLCSR